MWRVWPSLLGWECIIVLRREVTHHAEGLGYGIHPGLEGETDDHSARNEIQDLLEGQLIEPGWRRFVLYTLPSGSDFNSIPAFLWDGSDLKLMEGFGLPALGLGNNLNPDRACGRSLDPQADRMAAKVQSQFMACIIRRYDLTVDFQINANSAC